MRLGSNMHLPFSPLFSHSLTMDRYILTTAGLTNCLFTLSVITSLTCAIDLKNHTHKTTRKHSGWGVVGVYFRKRKFVLFIDASRAHWFSYIWLLDIKYMVMVTYFPRGNSLSPYRLLFLISSKGSFRCTFTQTGQPILQSLIDQFHWFHWLEWKIA